MKTISMLKFRVETKEVLKLLRSKQKIRLTYRGKALADLTPVSEDAPNKLHKNDPFYRMHEIAQKGGSLTNSDIDSIIYDKE